MNDDNQEALCTLHTRVVDAARGHEEAVGLAQDPVLSALFLDLREQHRRHAGELAVHMIARGIEPDTDGSFLQYVHKAILNVRSAIGGLDENALPGIRDGEERIIDLYDDAIRDIGSDTDLLPLLSRQREESLRGIGRIRALEVSAGV